MGKKKHKLEVTETTPPQPNPEPTPLSSSKKKKRKREKEKEDSTTLTARIPPDQDPDNPFPISTYFPSGFDSAESPPHKIRVLKHERHHKRLHLVVNPNESSPVEFAGTNFSGEGAAPQLCNFFLGLVDKDTLTVKFAPFPANKIFRLEPKVDGLDILEAEPAKCELTAENKAEKTKGLKNLYSTKAAIARQKKSEEIYQIQDTDNHEDLDRKAEEIKKNQQAIESVDALHNRNIPPYDASATTKEMAYPLNKIILAGEWDFLMDIFALSETEQDLAPEEYPSFVRNRVHLLGNKDEEEKKKLACIFSYITHLIKFKDKHSIDGVAFAKYHRFPSIIHHKFSTMFAPSDSKRLPEEKKSLLISYALVLSLYVDDFDTNPSDMAKDLRMSDMKIRPYFEHLGCKKHVRQGNLKFELRLPLEFPKPRPKRRR